MSAIVTDLKMSRKAFNFYQSHWEQIKLLNDTQKLELFNAICSVQFMEVNIDDIKFKDNISVLVWTGIKHSISTSISGFVNKNKSLNKDVAIPLSKGGNDTPKHTPCLQLKGEEEEKEQLSKPFSFSLSKNIQLSNTSKEYLSKLEDYIKNNYKGMSYKDFFDSCELKGYKYKNYKMAYDKWNKGYKSKEQSSTKMVEYKGKMYEEVVQ